MENLVYTALLALHTIALVGCAAAPFYNLRLVNQRGKHGQKIFYELDKVVEDTIQGLEPYCWAFIFTLFITGAGFPLTYYVFHGQIRDSSTLVLASLAIKLIFVFGMAGLVFYITFFINPKVKEIFSTFSPASPPDEEKRKTFFALRAKRKKLCQICFVFVLLILLASPVLRFY